MRVLHVANGHQVTSLILRAGIGGETSVWADPLHEGPVPAGLSDIELRAVRATYLADGDAVEPVLRDLESWSDMLDRRGAFDELVLWFEHDLFDQLNLLQVLDRLGPAPLTKTTMVSIREWPGKPSFKGMGELAPSDIAILFATRQPIEAPACELASRAWRAFRSADPRDIEMVHAGDTRALPFLADALHRHLQEFPSTHTGLSRSELRLLKQLDHAPADIRVAFEGMWDGETAFYMADASFWGLVRGLANAEPPLLTIERTEDAAGRLPKGRLTLTLQGRSVLEGTVDRIHLCGIETWRGGVHLLGRGAQWRWNPDTGQMVRV
jgi:hypothetical protein